MRDGYPIPLYSVGTLNTQIIEKEIYMTKIYEVTRSYTTCDVHVVKANNEEEAKKKVSVLGEYINHKSYDSDYDDEVTVWEVTDSELWKDV